LINFFEPLRTFSFDRGLNFKPEVLKNRHKLFKVSQFAEALHMSRATFRRHFEQNFGMNPHDWIHQERVKLVEQELKNSDLPLQQVAQKTGFVSIRDFYSFCRKHLGRTAMEIRKGAGL
jgi:AraC-like DNA-binding protein